MAAHGPRTTKRIDREHRRTRVLELRAQRMHLDDIAETVGCSLSTVRRDIDYALGETREERAEHTAALREMSTRELLDVIANAKHWFQHRVQHKAIVIDGTVEVVELPSQGDPQYLRAIVAAVDSLARLHGLNAPEQLEAVVQTFTTADVTAMWEKIPEAERRELAGLAS